MDNAQLLLLMAIALPGAAFLFLSASWLAGWTPREKFVSRLTAGVYLLAVVAVAALGWRMRQYALLNVSIDLRGWFHVGEYQFPLVLVVDRLSYPLIAMTVLLAGLIGKFSSTYLHRDRGFFRFYVLLHLFAFGALTVFCAGSLDALVLGWELVGITSVLLIAFFHYRAGPVENALRVFAFYRGCDIGLLIGAALMYHEGPPSPTTLGLLFLLAAAGKSAQVPFSGWLPRAMEGPTPSSAIFYGAISVHIGAYLMLRTRPLWEQSAVVIAAVAIVGAATAVYGTLAGRVSPDAKNSLANASLAQVGLIFVEIAFGLQTLALVHILGHAAVRTLQFLRAPSALHDYHRIHAAAGGHLAPTGRHAETLLPLALQRWLYRFALDRGHLDTLLQRLLIAPLFALSASLRRLDEFGGGLRTKHPVHPAPLIEDRKPLDA